LDRALLLRAADDLSGGEAQRLCLARTLLTRPEIVLMDEPTSSLDVASSSTVESIVRSLAEHGVGIVWVTHDLAQARRLSAQAIVLFDGRLADPVERERFLGARGSQDVG
jgi:putative ABC transport system ATP-binding protein